MKYFEFGYKISTNHYNIFTYVLFPHMSTSDIDLLNEETQNEWTDDIMFCREFEQLFRHMFFKITHVVIRTRGRKRVFEVLFRRLKNVTIVTCLFDEDILRRSIRQNNFPEPFFYDGISSLIYTFSCRPLVPNKMNHQYNRIGSKIRGLLKRR